MTNQNQINKEVKKIVDDLFRNFKEHDLTDEIITDALIKIENLGPLSYTAVCSYMSDGSGNKIGRFFSIIGERGKEFFDFTLRNGDQRQVHGALLILGSCHNDFGKNFIVKEVFDNEINKYYNPAANIIVSTYFDDNKLIEKYVNHDNPLIRKSFIDALGNKFKNSSQEEKERIISFLKKGLEDKEEAIRYSSFMTLKYNKSLTFEQIKLGFDDEYYPIRDSSILALFQYGITEELPAALIARMLEDKERRIIDEVIKYLGTSHFKIDYQLLIDSIIDTSIIRKNKLPDDGFNPLDISSALATMVNQSPRHYGYIINRLSDIALNHEDDIQVRCVTVAEKINEKDFLVKINQKSVERPSQSLRVKELLGINHYQKSIDDLYQVDLGDVQKNAVGQISLLNSYYKSVNTRSWISFIVAVIFMVIAFIFLSIIVNNLIFDSTERDIINIISAIISGLGEFIAITFIRIFKKSQDQQKDFQRQIEKTQRFLLANSACEKISEEKQDEIREKIISDS